MAAHTALGIGEGDDKNQPFLWHDLAKEQSAPHVLAVWRAQQIVGHGAGPEIERDRDDLEVFWSPPLAELFRFGPRVPHTVARRLERASDEEFERLGPVARLRRGAGEVGQACRGSRSSLARGAHARARRRTARESASALIPSCLA